MNTLELSRKAIETIGDVTFNATITENRYDQEEDIDLTLTKEQIMFLLHYRTFNNDLFDGIVEDYIDVAETLEAEAIETFNNGELRAYVADLIPEELQHIRETIDNIDYDDEEKYEKAEAEIVKMVEAAEDGNYTFEYCVADSSRDIEYIAEDELYIQLPLKAHEIELLVRAELWGEKEDEAYAYINARINQTGVASKYETKYEGTCEELDNYLHSWEVLLSKIGAGDVNESNIRLWLDFFEKEAYIDTTIEHWR